MRTGCYRTAVACFYAWDVGWHPTLSTLRSVRFFFRVCREKETSFHFLATEFLGSGRHRSAYVPVVASRGVARMNGDYIRSDLILAGLRFFGKRFVVATSCYVRMALLFLPRVR